MLQSQGYAVQESRMALGQGLAFEKKTGQAPLGNQLDLYVQSVASCLILSIISISTKSRRCVSVCRFVGRSLRPPVPSSVPYSVRSSFRLSVRGSVCHFVNKGVMTRVRNVRPGSINFCLLSVFAARRPGSTACDGNEDGKREISA